MPCYTNDPAVDTGEWPILDYLRRFEEAVRSVDTDTFPSIEEAAKWWGDQWGLDPALTRQVHDLLLRRGLREILVDLDCAIARDRAVTRSRVMGKLANLRRQRLIAALHRGGDDGLTALATLAWGVSYAA